MYWYYKVILLCISTALLYGAFTVAKSYFPDIASFSKPKEVNIVDAKTSEEGPTANQKPKELNPGPARNSALSQGLTPLQEALLLEAQGLYSEKQLLEDAYVKALNIFNDPKMIQFSKGWYKIADFMSEINTKLMLSSAPSDRKEVHKVVPGDSLDRIARGKTTIVALQKGNNIPLTSQTIYPGDFIRYFPGEWEIEIFKSEYTLILRHQGKFFKYYKIAIGKENRTPEGRFLIYGKVINPIWERKGHEAIQPGDPENVLGSRWMKLKPMEGTLMIGSGYGIHGTTEPNSIGTSASQGCIRMKNEEIEELFDIIPDTKVIVTIRN